MAEQKTPFHLGGQALVEGVMMRSPRFIAASVRRANGAIETRVERFDSILLRFKFLRWPLIRGFVALLEMMLVGTRFLRWSADVALESSEKMKREQENSVSTQGRAQS